MLLGLSTIGAFVLGISRLNHYVLIEMAISSSYNLETRAVSTNMEMAKCEPSYRGLISCHLRRIFQNSIQRKKEKEECFTQELKLIYSQLAASCFGWQWAHTPSKWAEHQRTTCTFWKINRANSGSRLRREEASHWEVIWKFFSIPCSIKIHSSVLVSVISEPVTGFRDRRQTLRLSSSLSKSVDL